jgi:hypothetical protein
MGRPRISGKPLDPNERRMRSDEAKKQMGERKLSNWISKDANDALQVLTGGEESRGVIKAAIETALINEAARQTGKNA